MTSADPKPRADVPSRVHEEAGARGIDESMLRAMLDQYVRTYGAEPETLSQLVCGVFC